MTQLTRFDAHCHIFTLRYVLKEAKSMLYDMYHNNYPWEKPEKVKVALAQQKDIESFKKMMRWLFELTTAALISERRNLNFLQREAGKVFPNDRHAIIPLSIDIFYIFAYNLDENEDYPTSFKTQSNLQIGAELQEVWDEVLADLKNYITEKYAGNQSALSKIRVRMLEDVLNDVDLEKVAKRLAFSSTKPILKAQGIDYYHTEGFDYHLQNLMRLVWYRRSELYPFVAVDPRREGMIETVMSGKFFEGPRRFYGVKLYPRLGYHPQCKPLMPLYKYCEDNNIPITYHCGMSGFPPGTGWKWADYGKPTNFEPIVKAHPNLRINFAHMGSRDPDRQWEVDVLNLVKNNTNVYTDLSCYTDFDDLNSMRKYWDQTPELHSKLMYGSDFDVMYFVGDKINVEDYIRNFQKVFPDGLTRMMVDNPKTFLGVEEQPLNCLQKILRRIF
jgi:predicted TIM-barrel fold metal-dependent hydrolase